MLSFADVTGGIKRGFFTLLQVCAFLLFFCAINACLAVPLAKATPLWRVLLGGVLEMTGGISAAANTLPPSIAFRMTAFFSSFAGLSVCFQILSITEGAGVRISHYLAAKLTQGGIALLLCEGYLYFFHPVLSPVESVPTGTFSARVPAFTVMLALLLLGILLRKGKALQNNKKRRGGRF